MVIYLLTGITTIKRKPWKPNKYGCYFFVDTDGCTIKEEWFDDCITDVLCYKLGNCYRTYEEAGKIRISVLLSMHLMKFWRYDYGENRT